MQFSYSKKSALAVVLGSAVVVSCGGGGGSSGDDGGSTEAIAGLWDIPDDSILGFELLEISANGALTDFSEDTVNNCFRTSTGTLINEGNDNYGFVGPTSDVVIVSYNLVNEGDSLTYTTGFAGVVESWQSLEGVVTSDFNICP